MMDKNDMKRAMAAGNSRVTGESGDVLDAEGLCRDPAHKPASYLYEMFEILVKHKKIPKKAIRDKISAFYSFIVMGKLQGVPKCLADILSLNSSAIQEDIENDRLFFNTHVITLFAYLFGVRLELFYIGRNGNLSRQYFGIKKKTVKRVYMTEESYHVLKKSLPKTNTFSTRICSDAEYDNDDFRDLTITSVRPNSYLNDNRDLTITSLSNNNNLQFNAPIFNKPKVNNEHEEDSSNDDPSPGSTYRANDVDLVLTSWTNDILAVDQANSVAPSKRVQEKPDISLGLTHRSVEGKLKFYSEVKEYGFIIMEDESEVFVHKADLIQQNIDTRCLAYYNKFYNIFLKFDVEEYQGKLKVHRKAINMIIINMVCCDK